MLIASLGRNRRARYLGQLAPGLLLAATIALAATFLGEHYGAPVMLFALLIGMAFHFLADDEKCYAGIDFASRQLLRTGVALLGARITLDEISSLGIAPLVLIAICVPATICFGLVVDRLSGRDGNFGLLTGGAVAICGASAALALAAVLPQKDGHRNAIFTIITVTGLSTIAMITYPILFDILGFTDREAGILIGATIHDVAQVVGAGYAFSDEAGDTATYVKLLRVALLPFVVILLAVAGRETSPAGRVQWPTFTVWFFLILLCGSFGLIPSLLRETLVEASGWFLVTAIVSLGIKTSLKTMLDHGGARFALILAETIFLLGLAMAGVSAVF